MEKWFYSKDGVKQEGPVKKSDAKKIYKDNPSTLFWHSGMPRWKKGEEVFKLAILYKFILFVGILGVFGGGSFFALKYFKPVELPPEIAIFQRSFETISSIPLQQRIAMDVFADKSRGLIIFSNLPNDTKIEVEVPKSREKFTLVVFDHYAWKKDINFPKGRFEIKLLSNELPDLRSIPGISIVQGNPRFSSTFRYLLYDDPNWNVYLQHVGTLKEIVKDFREGYSSITKQKLKPEKIKSWKSWAPGWSKFFNQWAGSAIQATQADPSLFKPLRELHDIQAKSWLEMTKVILKDPKEHATLKKLMAEAEQKISKLNLNQ